MTRQVFSPVWGLCGSLLVGIAQTAHGELGPNHIAILANGNSQPSLAVARHYAERRGVPIDRIIPLDVPTDDTISRTQYERQVVQPVRKVLHTRRSTSQVRVLLTTYGIPLRVAAPEPSEQEQRWQTDAAEHERFARVYLEKIPAWALTIASDDAARESPDESRSHDTPAGPDPPHQALLERVNAAIRHAVDRLQRARNEHPSARVTAWTNDLIRLVAQVGGTAALARTTEPSPAANPDQVRKELAKLKQDVSVAEKLIEALAGAPSDLNRKRAYQLTERIFGLQGVLQLATSEVERFGYQDGDASLDSELSLLWWDPDMYRIAGRLPNPLHYENAMLPDTDPSIPVLMVSRLDAPTPDLAMGLVDQAMETERRGLSGKIYIDAQGSPPAPPFGYGYYDESLRALADLFRRHSSYQVILDNTARRYSRKGEAPDVAAYVGWYKLRSYEDAFAFKPGAIGYHIASAEAMSIHNPNEPGWCKNALERGITVTLGPTGEPYLDAFPPPMEFFGLLLTGRYTLVEAFALSSRYVSWRMALFGDPLYNPWRGKTQVGDPAQIFATAPQKPIGFPRSPSTLKSKDPIHARDRFQQTRQARLREVASFLEQLDLRSRPAR